MYWSELWHRDNHHLDHNLHYNQYDSDNCNTANPRRRFILLYHFIYTIRNPFCRNCISDQYRVTYGCIFNSLQSCVSADRACTFCKKTKLAGSRKTAEIIFLSSEYIKHTATGLTGGRIYIQMISCFIISQ